MFPYPETTSRTSPTPSKVEAHTSAGVQHTVHQQKKKRIESRKDQTGQGWQGLDFIEVGQILLRSDFVEAGEEQNLHNMLFCMAPRPKHSLIKLPFAYLSFWISKQLPFLSVNSFLLLKEALGPLCLD